MFVEPARGRVRHEVARLPGVLQAEGFRALPVRLRAGHHMRRIGLVGLEPGSALVRLFDERKRTVLLPPDGLVLSTKLADLLQVRPGDEITVEVLEGQRPKRQVLVRGLVTEYGGLNAYMQLAALHRLVREADALSGMHLTVARPARAALYHTLKQTPRVASVTVKEAALQSFRDTVAENLLRIRMFNILFASVIAFGVVYNSARIALAERSRDLATLRVIGFTRGEISGILLGELAVLTLAAIPLGMLLGYLFAGWVTRGLDTELYRVPLVIDRSTYAFAVTVVLLAALFSGLVVRRKLDHLDLVAVLKTKE
jgi:putative ABC transport system permease protein